MIGIIGTGGHAKVISDIYDRVEQERKLIFFTSHLPSTEEGFENSTIYPDTDDYLQYFSKEIKQWHVAIGKQEIRKEKIKFLREYHCTIVKAIHDRSIIAKQNKIGEGTSIMAGATINPYTIIGTGCIINTTASIDHDCQISDFVNIGPGAKLAGGVKIGELTELGTGAIVIPNKNIGKNCIIGAGAVVTRNIPDNSVAVGVPATIIGQKKELH